MAMASTMSTKGPTQNAGLKKQGEMVLTFTLFFATKFGYQFLLNETALPTLFELGEQGAALRWMPRLKYLKLESFLRRSLQGLAGNQNATEFNQLCASGSLLSHM